MTRFLYIFATLLLLLSSCGKNELHIAVNFPDAENRTLRIVYRAANSEGGFLVDQQLPFAQGAMDMRVATRYPTVVWILSTSGQVLMPVYAEKGDNLTLTGKYADPASWVISGNKVMDAYAAWAKQEANTLKADNPEAVNAAVAKYVKAHPEDPAAAFILFTRYRRTGHEKEFQGLRASLKIDEDDLQQMEDACILTAPNPAPSPLKQLTLPDERDSLVTLKTSGHAATLLYFWRDTYGKTHSDAKALFKDLYKATASHEAKADTSTAKNAPPFSGVKPRKSAPALQLVNVYMDLDTMTWRRTLKSDTILGQTVALRAVGAEATPALAPLNIPSVPYFVVLSTDGKPLYAGPSPAEARKALPKK